MRAQLTGLDGVLAWVNPMHDGDEHGRDSYVLCEINVSAVWPFPPMASMTIAANTAARIIESRQGNGPPPLAG